MVSYINKKELFMNGSIESSGKSMNGSIESSGKSTAANLIETRVDDSGCCGYYRCVLMLMF